MVNLKQSSIVFNIILSLFVLLATGSYQANLAYAGEDSKSDSDTNITESPIVQVLCRAVNFIQKGPGKIVAMLILISLAIALFLGKVTWGLAIAVGVGIGLMMGASNIMKILSGDNTDVCEVVTKKKE